MPTRRSPPGAARRAASRSPASGAVRSIQPTTPATSPSDAAASASSSSGLLLGRRRLDRDGRADAERLDRRAQVVEAERAPQRRRRRRSSTGSRGAPGPRGGGGRRRAVTPRAPARAAARLRRRRSAHSASGIGCRHRLDVGGDLAPASARRPARRRRPGGAAGRPSPRRGSATPWRSQTAAIAARPLQPRGARAAVVEGRAVARVGEDAAVEHAAGDHRDAALDAQRQQLRRRAVVEQRVAAGEQDAVDVGLADEPGSGATGSCPRRSRRSRPRRAARPAPGSASRSPRRSGRRGRARRRRRPGRARAASRLSSSERRTPSALKSQPRRVASPAKSSANIDGAARPPARHQQPPDLGGEHELRARALAQRGAEPPLGDSPRRSAARCRSADAEPPGRVDGRARVRVADRLVEAAERGACRARARAVDCAHQPTARAQRRRAVERSLTRRAAGAGPACRRRRRARSRWSRPTPGSAR